MSETVQQWAVCFFISLYIYKHSSVFPKIKNFEYQQYFILKVDHIITLYALKIMKYKHKSTERESHMHSQIYICQN
jgi:hypothetical protein